MTLPVAPSAAGPATTLPPAPHDPHARLREVAQDLEAAFLTEMLKHAGFGEARESFGGGIGEEQITSMLRDEHAQAITQQGGLGLSEQIFQSLVNRAEAGQ
jgi:flagellar protein FlgJ